MTFKLQRITFPQSPVSQYLSVVSAILFFGSVFLMFVLDSTVVICVKIKRLLPGVSGIDYRHTLLVLKIFSNLHLPCFGSRKVVK